MRFIKLTLVSLVLIVFSCDNEVDIAAPFEDITVLYGLLDPNEDTNWVRVERGYLGNAAASASFNQPDSLYYSDITVILKEFDRDGALLDSIELVKDETSRSLNPGTFTTDGYRIYRIDKDISSTNHYEVLVIKNNGGPVARATTFVVPVISIILPTTTPGSSQSLWNNNILWNHFGQTPTRPDPNQYNVLYQPVIYLTYKEFDINTRVSEIKTVRFQYADVERSPNSRTDDLSVGQANANADFLNILRSNITIDENKLRFFQDIDIEIWGANQEFYLNMQLNAPSSGINVNTPQISGVENGTGFLASRTVSRINDVLLSVKNANDVIRSEITCDLRFASIEPTNPTGDTCICNNLPGTSNSTICF